MPITAWEMEQGKQGLTSELSPLVEIYQTDDATLAHGDVVKIVASKAVKALAGDVPANVYGIVLDQQVTGNVNVLVHGSFVASVVTEISTITTDVLKAALRPLGIYLR